MDRIEDYRFMTFQGAPCIKKKGVLLSDYPIADLNFPSISRLQRCDTSCLSPATTPLTCREAA